MASTQVHAQEQENLEMNHNKEPTTKERKNGMNVQLSSDVWSRGYDQNVTDWKTVAVVLDMFLFHLFFVLTTAVNIVVVIVILSWDKDTRPVGCDGEIVDVDVYM